MANPYTFTKHQAEDIIKMYSLLYDVPSCITRFYNVFGPYAATEGAYCNVLGIFDRQFKEGRPLTITGDGKQRRDFIHVQDVARANYLAATTPLDDYLGEVFNVGSGTCYTVKQIADAISNNQTYIPTRKGEMDTTFADISKIKKVIGWEPEIDVLDWLK